MIRRHRYVRTVGLNAWLVCAGGRRGLHELEELSHFFQFTNEMAGRPTATQPDLFFALGVDEPEVALRDMGGARRPFPRKLRVVLLAQVDGALEYLVSDENGKGPLLARSVNAAATAFATNDLEDTDKLMRTEVGGNDFL